MADKRDHENTYLDNGGGTFSSVDVDNVDIKAYPNFKKVTFYNASIEAGDCVYIPWKWHHYVKSFGRLLS